jgi:hypothetical protein
VLERAGGRKTTILAKAKEIDTVVVADWITQALPATEMEE